LETQGIQIIAFAVYEEITYLRMLALFLRMLDVHDLQPVGFKNAFIKFPGLFEHEAPDQSAVRVFVYTPGKLRLIIIAVLGLSIQRKGACTANEESEKLMALHPT
jgi:hypothetical protein